MPPAAPEVGSNDTVYTTVKVKLTGRYMPIPRRPPRQLQIPAQRTDGQSAEGSEPGSADTLLTYDGDEADLSALLDQATRQAEDVHGEALRQSSAWDQLMRLLPLLTQAQAMLLVHEHSRCRQVEQRRGRTTNVRFLCYDMSAVDPRPPPDASREDDHELVAVLAELVSRQRALLETHSVS